MKFERIDDALKQQGAMFLNKRHLLCTRRVLQAIAAYDESLSFVQSLIEPIRRLVLECGMNETQAFHRFIAQIEHLKIDNYLCTCGVCPDYLAIEFDCRHVPNATRKRQLTRMLQAYSTFNEQIGYQPGMIALAETCLKLCNGDEERAFIAFTIFVQERHLQLENALVQV